MDQSDPKALKKLEKAIASEQKEEDKNVKRVTNELHNSEKVNTKLTKDVQKAEKTLTKNEKRERGTMDELQRATHKHDIAVADLHSAQADLQVKQQQSTQVGQDLQNKKARADELAQQFGAHSQEREARLGEIRGAGGSTN